MVTGGQITKNCKKDVKGVTNVLRRRISLASASR